MRKYGGTLVGLIVKRTDYTQHVKRGLSGPQRRTTMFNIRNLISSFCCVMLWTIPIHAQDLSRYREFHLGMDLAATAKQTHMELFEAKVLHQRPALIQELEWRPHLALVSIPEADPLKEVLFSF